MRITFIGTSHGIPEPGRKCSCTMIEAGGRYYFVDMGTSAIEDVHTMGVPVDAIGAVFITHMHGDHTNGLIQFADLLTWYYKDASPAIFLPRIEGAKMISDWIGLQYVSRELDYREVSAGVIFDDGTLKVTAVRTQHCDVSYAYILEGDGKAVLFTGDLKNPGVDFPEIAKTQPLDLAVCEAGHFPASDYTSVMKEGKIAKVCINHCYPRYLASVNELREAMGDTPVILANDGMVISL